MEMHIGKNFKLNLWTQTVDTIYSKAWYQKSKYRCCQYTTGTFFPFFTNNIIDQIMIQMILYYDQVKASKPATRLFTSTYKEGIMAFFGIILAMGITNNSRKCQIIGEKDLLSCLGLEISTFVTDLWWFLYWWQFLYLVDCSAKGQSKLWQTFQT